MGIFRTIVRKLKEPSTHAGLAGLALAIPNIVGFGQHAAEIAAGTLTHVGQSLAGGMPLWQAVLIGFPSLIAIGADERPRD